jgi:hypothetical protein
MSEVATRAGDVAVKVERASNVENRKEEELYGGSGVNISIF